jgi:Domain of unknown function (DUF1707)
MRIMTDHLSSPGSVRVGDRERTEAAERLSAHAAAGRLDLSELEERLERANAAVYAHELAALESDLPGPRAARPHDAWPPRRFPFPLLVPLVAVLAASVALSLAVGHPVAPLFFLVALLWWRGAGFARVRRFR